MLFPVVTTPLYPALFAGFPATFGGHVTATVGTGGTSFSGYTGTAATPLRDLKPLSDSFKGQIDRPLSLSKNYDKLARELAVRDPQLLAMIAPYKSVPNATFTIARVGTATTGGPGFSETIHISTSAKTGGPSGKSPTGTGLSFNFASLGMTIVIDQILATKIESPYQRGGVILGSYALASRISTGSWAAGKSAVKGFVAFNFWNNVTTSALDIFGVDDPKVLAYGAASITAATMLAHSYMARGSSLTLKGVETAAGSRGISAVVPNIAGKILKVVQVLDIVGGVAEDIAYDTSKNRTKIYLNYERQEMRDRAPTGLKWTTNFAFVRWPMRWFGGADDAADRKADEYIAGEIVPQLNDLAARSEALLLSGAARAVAEAQLEMVDPCLTDVAAKDADPNHKIRTQCTVAINDELLSLRKKELGRVGIIPKDKSVLGEMDYASWNESPWKMEGVWGESDESLRYQFFEHLRDWTLFMPEFDLNPDDMGVFRDAHIWNDTVSKLDAAKPWNDLVSFIDAKGKIKDYRAFGDYLKAPVLKRCDEVAGVMTENLLALAETCFGADGSFDREKFAGLVSAYYNPRPEPGSDGKAEEQMRAGIEEFYNLLVIDSVNGAASKGQEIAGFVDAKGRIKDMDNAVLFLMKAFHQRNAGAEGRFRQVLKESGLNPDLAVVTDAATGAVTVKTDLLTPGIEQNIRDKGGDEIARNLLLDPLRVDRLYDALTSPLSREWIDQKVLGIPATTTIVASK